MRLNNHSYTVEILMNRFILGTALAATVFAVQAQTPTKSPTAVVEQAKAAVAVALCDQCGTVQEVKQEKRKGKGGALGMIGGAVAGGLLGNQVGGGTGKTIATVGGAVGGAVVGNEVQKQVTSKKVWVTTVKMKDGSIAKFEQEPQPAWAAGNVVKVNGQTLTKM
jgi:outer membrane lipoprotein SlyB